MEPLIFYEKNLPGGSEPNDEQLIKSGTISLDGRTDLHEAKIYYGDDYVGWIRGDGEQWWTRLAYPDYTSSPCGCFYTEFWRSGASEISYRIKLGADYVHGGSSDLVSHADDRFKIDAEFNSGDNLSLSLPISIVNENDYAKGHPPLLQEFNVESEMPYLPKTVDWDFGGLENIYAPGNYSDPWRYQYYPYDISDYDISHTRWGITKDGSALLRVYEDARPANSSLELNEIKPNGDGIRNYRAENRFYHPNYYEQSIKVLYNGKEYELSFDTDTTIDMEVGTITFEPRSLGGPTDFNFVLNKNVDHSDNTKIDIFNQQLTLQLTDPEGNVNSRDILVQIVDDAPFVRGDATMDLSGVAAWTLGGNKLPLSYDYLKDVLYRSTDYNDWATGFKVTNCEGKYGSIGVFGDDGNPDDPASAPGAAYYMVDPAKITFVAPDQAVTEVIEYTYTDSDGDTANGVLNIALKGTGLNPAEAIKITPHAGNVPTSGGDVPVDNPYVPGNPADPDRDLNSSGAGDYDPMNPNWGQDKDGNALMRVFESGLPNGSEAGQRNVTAHGYLDIDATVGLQSIVATTDGTDSYGFEDNIMNIPLNGGTLTLTQKQDEKYLKYEFTLTNPVMHETGNGINSDEQHVTLTATDNYGNVEAIGLEVQIIDDVPKPSDPAELHTFVFNNPLFSLGCIMHQVHYGEELHPINIMHSGADFNFGDSKSSILVNPMDGKYGHFEISGDNNSDAEIIYWIDPEKIASVNRGDVITETLNYSYIDSDGDTGTDSVNYILNGPGLMPEPHTIVNENDFTNGAILNADGFEIIRVSRQPEYGILAQDDNGVWRYKLSHTQNFGGVQGADITHNVDIVGLDVNYIMPNQEACETFIFGYIDIIDSVPTFTASQNRLAYDFGADNGPGSGLKVAVGGAETDLVPGIETMIAGQHGMLTLSADGSCHYSPNSDYAGEDRFNFTIIDSDGDRALATVVASMVDGAPQTAINVQTADELAATQLGALGVPDGDSGGFIGA